MTMTNAERQARWRERHKEEIAAARRAMRDLMKNPDPGAEHEQLRQEIERLRAQLSAKTDDYDIRELRATVSRLRTRTVQLQRQR